MAKVLTIFGTRPEAIKMAPVVKAIESSPYLDSVVCVTGQHRDLLDQVLKIFNIRTDFDLDLMKPGQDLFHITAGCIQALRQVFHQVNPSLTLVHGDTTTAMSAAICSFYHQIDVGHVEAGLRTHDRYSPFPEEMNRRLIGVISDIHFAPSEHARANLLRENVEPGKIVVTGNTAIDALLWIRDRQVSMPHFDEMIGDRNLIFMTAHRRENFGRPLETIFKVVKRFAEESPDFHIIYPVHPNPNVKDNAFRIMGCIDNISLVEPVNYTECVYLLNKSQFVLTDSGGLQEEAPALGKPVLVLRENSERPEVIESGCGYLVGCHEQLILSMMRRLSDKSSLLYQAMSKSINPYGDGTAASKIATVIERRMGYAKEPELLRV